MKLEQLKEKLTAFFTGEVKLSKLNFILLTAVLVLAGMCIGLLTAPLTHGVNIGCNNGCNNGNNSPCHNIGKDDDNEDDIFED